MHGSTSELTARSNVSEPLKRKLSVDARVASDGFRWRPRQASWCVVVASAYSLTDELHQVFSPGRHASLIDCGIDTTGAAIAMVLVYGCSRLSAAINSKGFAQ